MGDKTGTGLAHRKRTQPYILPPPIARAFKAMRIGASFVIAGFGKVDLW